MTTVISPDFSIDVARAIVKNNQSVKKVVIDIETDETWLPRVLVDAGFFDSGNRVKKNQPGLWRDIQRPGEVVELSWAEIRITQVHDTSVAMEGESK